MARKKVIVESRLKNWDEVNASLRMLAEKRSYVDGEVARYNEKEAQRREKLDEKLNPMRGEIKDIEEDLKLFCDENRDAFGKKKSREFPNGLVGYRTGMPKLKTLKGFTFKAALELVKRSVFREDYIRVKEELARDKIIQDALTGAIDKDVTDTMGVEVVQDETFFYEARVATEDKAA